MMAAYPAGIRAYDLLADGGGGPAQPAVPSNGANGWRPSSRAIGEPRASTCRRCSPFETWEGLAALRAEPPAGDAQAAEGLMLKRWDSPL